MLHSEPHIVRAVSLRRIVHAQGMPVDQYRCIMYTAYPIVICRSCKTCIHMYVRTHTKRKIPNDCQDANRSRKEDQQFQVVNRSYREEES